MSTRSLWGVAGLLLWAGCGDSGEGAARSALRSTDDGGGTGNLSDLLYQDDQINDFHLTMSPADWDSIVWDTMGEEYRHAGLRWKTFRASDVGVRVRGHSTRYAGNPKPSLKIDVNVFLPGQKFMGLKEVKLDGLREDTQMRERLAYGIFRSLIPAAPRAMHCRLYVNGEYRGLYMVEEAPNGDLVKHRYPGESTGLLYHIFVADPEAYAYRGSDPDLYQDSLGRPWGRETHELDGDHTVVPRFLDILNHQPSAVELMCDTDNLATYLALEGAIVSRDGILRNAGPPQNHFAYYRLTTGRFEFLPWDLDQCLSNGEATRSIWHNFGNSYITRLVRDTPALNALYRERLRYVVQNLTRPDLLNARIDSIYGQIREHVYADPYKRITNEQFDSFPAYLKRVVQTRYDNLQAQLAAP